MMITIREIVDTAIRLSGKEQLSLDPCVNCKNLDQEFSYVHWYNHIRLHLSRGYMSPAEYKNLHLKKIV